MWFGVGFNATCMKDAPWAVIVDGTGVVSERKLQDQNPGSELAPSVTVVASSTANGTRTVVLTRPFAGKGADYFSFSAAGGATQLNIIHAVGSTPALSVHKAKAPALLTLLPTAGAGACLCATAPKAFGQQKGSLKYTATSESADTGSGTVSCCNTCSPEPRSDMLDQKNPTCDIRTYTGGQIACHHMWSLLDADQEIPWPDQPLEYHMKFRFWVQEYNASYHTQVSRTTWGIASPVEYDVPKCGPNVKGCSRHPNGVDWIHTIKGTYEGHGSLVAAHFHCHAPTCLSVKMYRNDTGELLCEERPIYGGTASQDPNPHMDEPGFIAVPPCLWASPNGGDPSLFGLEASPDLGSGTMLHSVKTANATDGHHGEMAWQQMYFH